MWGVLCGGGAYLTTVTTCFSFSVNNGTLSGLLCLRTFISLCKKEKKTGKGDVNRLPLRIFRSGTEMSKQCGERWGGVNMRLLTKHLRHPLPRENKCIKHGQEITHSPNTRLTCKPTAGN